MSYAPIYNELVEKATTKPLEYRYSELWEALLRAEKYIVKMEALQTARPEALRNEIIEECAKVCDQNEAACEAGFKKSGGVPGYALQAEGSRECADAVRALKTTPSTRGKQ